MDPIPKASCYRLVVERRDNSGPLVSISLLVPPYLSPYFKRIPTSYFPSKAYTAIYAILLFSSFTIYPSTAVSFFSHFKLKMANAASGMAVDDDCKLKFQELKSKRNYRFIIFKIEEQQVVVEKLGSHDSNYQDFTGSLPSDECRYAVFDFDFTTSENCQKSKIFFIAWSPDSSKVRMKMVYASSKDRFKRELDGIQVELQATDPSEMSFDIIKERAF